MKLIMPTLLIISTLSHADVKWDIPVERFNEFTDEITVMDLTVGDTAIISIEAIFCTNKDGNIALSGTEQVGTGDIKIKMLPGKKVAIEVHNNNAFIKELIYGESYAPCEWWTAHKGKYVFTVDNINGKNTLSSLYKKP